jgi:fructose-1,6-bisphosphatase/inositol monophosphatase family enzyme
MSDLDALLPIARAAVDEAAELARTQPPGSLTPKGDRDYASEMDFEIERRVRDFLNRQTPGIAFVGEEENGPVADRAEWWTLDPIDGTVNFAHALPLCAVSLALAAGQALRVRMFGSAALDLAWLAEGKVDASITFSNRSWDVSEGVILAREAGARVVDRDGSEYSTDASSTIAASPGLCDEVLELVQVALQAKASRSPM